jgi:hypothetical protein
MLGMTPEERFARFEEIKAAFHKRDTERLGQGKLSIRETEFGLWGTTNLNDAYELCKRLKMERFKGFIDLGCGDGRIVAIASLFTKAYGVEGDADLVNEGKEILSELGLDPELISNGNYYETDLQPFDILFMFPDNRYDEEIVKKFKNEVTGYLLVYNDIHRPEGIRRGKTIWIEQLPIVSYLLNTDKDITQEGHSAE